MPRILRSAEFDLLSGLRDYGPFVLTATEANVAMRLANEGLVHTYTTPVGFTATGQPSMITWAWEITNEGEEALKFSSGRTLL